MENTDEIDTYVSTSYTLDMFGKKNNFVYAKTLLS